MTKRDFKAIAAIIAGDYATANSKTTKTKVRGIAYSLADYFAKTYPRFDRAKFYAACFPDDK